MSDRPGDDDLAQLAALPQRRNEHDPLPKARAAFDRAFDREPEAPPMLVGASVGSGGGLVARAVVPVTLAAIVAIYLLWVLSAAFALHG
ncbi:MAG: hypothetical protein U0270_25480 [Labilithrix sp.]